MRGKLKGEGHFGINIIVNYKNHSTYYFYPSLPRLGEMMLFNYR